MTAELDPMALAIEIATTSAGEGGGPFGAVILLPDGRFVWGSNRVTADHDPTAHAEVTAIRRATSVLGDHDLSGAILYTSCQPCPMCLAASLWARLDRIVYAATAAQAADAGFDDASFYSQLRGGISTVVSAAIDHDPRPDATAPFQAWTANLSRTEY